MKNTLLKQGLRWLSDPRVSRWVQDERVMRALMTAMSVPGKAQTFARDQVDAFAKAMALATEGEVKDLRRTMRRLEDELTQLKLERTEPHPKSDAAE